MASAERDARTAWRFVRQVEAWIVALERFRIAVSRVPAALADGTWEVREAVAKEVEHAEQEVRESMSPFEGDVTVSKAFARELQAAKDAKEWALHQRLNELSALLDELRRWLHPPSSQVAAPL